MYLQFVSHRLCTQLCYTFVNVHMTYNLAVCTPIDLRRVLQCRTLTFSVGCLPAVEILS